MFRTSFHPIHIVMNIKTIKIDYIVTKYVDELETSVKPEKKKGPNALLSAER